MLSIVELVLVLVCLAAGAALGWLAARSRSAAEIARLDATLRATREGEARLERSLRALSYEASEHNQQAVALAVAPRLVVEDSCHGTRSCAIQSWISCIWEVGRYRFIGLR